MPLPENPIIITYPYALGEANGGARMTLEIGRHLGRLGENVILMPVSRIMRGVNDQDKRLGLDLGQDLLRENVHVQRVSAHRMTHRLDGWNVQKRLRSLLQQCRPRAVLSYFFDGAFLPGLLNRYRVPFGYISTWQSYEMSRQRADAPGTRRLFRKWAFSRLIRKPHRAADILFATSQFTKRELQRVLGVLPERIQVCYLGVGEAFLGIPREKRSACRRIIFFGRLVENKGVEDALDAMAQVRDKGNHDWQFKLFGSGDKGWVRSLVRARDLSDNVQVHSEIDTCALIDELAQADLALMPSWAESFGLSNAEAQASGIPVVAYAVGSVPEVIDHGKTGWLAPLRDVNTLADHVRQALGHPERTYQMGLAARENVRAKFTWRQTAQTIRKGLAKPQIQLD